MIIIPFDEENKKRIIKEQSDNGMINNGEMNLFDGDFLTFVTSEESKDKFEEWLKTCPDNKLKDWIKEGREFFK